jgi:hypothetical protein
MSDDYYRLKTNIKSKKIISFCKFNESLESLLLEKDELMKFLETQAMSISKNQARELANRKKYLGKYKGPYEHYFVNSITKEETKLDTY